MKILVTGANGQLGRCLFDILSSEEQMKNMFPNKEDFRIDYYFADRSQIDITDENLYDILSDMKPDVIINCAAYTDTYGAETNQELAFKANTYGVSNLATACSRLGIKLIHISTDYVFDGKKSTPYTEDDACNPLNMYGVTKFFGESYIRSICPTAIIVRTSWLYSEYGNNFVKKTVERLKEKNYMAYVTDEVSVPTYARNLAKFIMFLVIRDYTVTDPIYHISGIINFTDNGIASRYDFAKAIEEYHFGEDMGFVRPCLTKNIVDTIKRPPYSVLDNSKGLKLVTEYTSESWRTALKRCVCNIGCVNLSEPVVDQPRKIYREECE